MRLLVRCVLVALVVGAGACTSSERTDEFTAADRQAITQRTQQLATAFNAKQMDAIIELYADNSVFMQPNGPALRGREPLREFYQDLIARATNLRLESEDIVGHGPLGYETGTYSLEYQGGAVRDRGKYVFIWRKMADTWRTEKTIWSSDLPPPSPPKTE